MKNKKNVIVDSEKIRKDIENLLYDRFDISKNLDLNDGEDNFFGEYGLLEPRELTYLAYMLENKYDIQFSMEEYDDIRFYNLSGLSEIIAEVISRKNFKMYS